MSPDGGSEAWEGLEPAGESESWTLAYGNLMSYLMIIFLFLFVAASTKSVAVQMSLKAVQQNFGGPGAAWGEFYSQYGVQKFAKLDIRENKMRIIFSDPVLFDTGKASLKESSLGPLKRLSEALKEVPNQIQIEGHTDDRPIARGAAFSSNWELSGARAFAVLRFLETSGVSPQRLSAIGYGEFRALKPNDSEENRAVNRRTEVNIIRLEE